MYEYFAYVYVFASCLCLVPTEVREGVGFPRTGVTDICELLCVFWDPNVGPLQEHQMLLTTVHSLQLSVVFFKNSE
jgi:hypothetical protein